MTEKPAPVAPRPAASILLLRDGPAGLETFMVVRHHQIDFASGALVFPGGRMEAADAEIVAAPADPLAPFKVAAIREAFEECGVLLARAEGEDGFVAGRPRGRARPRRALRRSHGEGKARAGARRARAVRPLDHARLRAEALRHPFLPGAGPRRPGARPRRARGGRIRSGSRRSRRWPSMGAASSSCSRPTATCGSSRPMRTPPPRSPPPASTPVVTVQPERVTVDGGPGLEDPGRGRLRRRGVLGRRAAVAPRPLCGREAPDPVLPARSLPPGQARDRAGMTVDATPHPAASPPFSRKKAITSSTPCPVFMLAMTNGRALRWVLASRAITSRSAPT